MSNLNRSYLLRLFSVIIFACVVEAGSPYPTATALAQSTPYHHIQEEQRRREAFRWWTSGRDYVDYVICPRPVETYDTAYDRYMSSACWGVAHNDLNTAIINFRRALRERPNDYDASLGLNAIEVPEIVPLTPLSPEQIAESERIERERQERLAPPPSPSPYTCIPYSWRCR